MLVSGRIDFIENNITRGKECFFKMTKGPTNQEYITILDVYAPNNRDWKHERKSGSIIRNNRQIHD